MSDPLWTKDFYILFKSDRVLEFFPIKEFSHEEKVNAIVRLSFYVSVILSIYYSNAKYFSIFIFFLFFTFVIYKYKPEENILSTIETKVNNKENKVQQKVEQKFKEEATSPRLNNFTPSLGLSQNIEKLENENRPDDVPLDKCTKPTIDNPFMNPTMKDYMNFNEKGSIVDRPPACDPRNPEIKKMIDQSFNNNLYKDVSDVFGKMSSQRNYFTMPWTTIPNKQDEFARWLYLSPKTCKEDQDNCLKYEDIRSKRFIMPNPERNPITSKKLEQ
jgi:hypothetical protein